MLKKHLDRKLSNLSVGTKIWMLFIPSLIVVFLISVVMVNEGRHDYFEAKKVGEFATYTRTFDQLAHEFAVERGLTAGFLASKGRNGKAKLMEQRANADQTKEQFLALSQRVSGALTPSLNAAFAKVSQSLEKVDRLRTNVDSLSPNSNAFNTYSEINKSALDAISLINYHVTDLKVLKQLNGLHRLLWLKERAGQERGALNGIFTGGTYSPQQASSIMLYINDAKARIDYLERKLDPELLEKLQDILTSSASKSVQSYREAFLNSMKSNSGLIKGDAAQWFADSTRRIVSMKALSNEMEDRIEATVASKKTIALWAIITELVVCSLLLYTLFYLGRTISKQLTGNIEKITVSVSETRRNKDFSLRICNTNNDELGEAAQAYNQLMQELQTVFDDVNSTFEQISKGDFSARIERQLTGDLQTLKQGVNASADKVEFTMSELGQIMSALQAGNFDARMSDKVEGHFKQQVDGAMETMDQAIQSVADVLFAMSQGNFSLRIEQSLNGSLNSLKNSVNRSSDSIEQAINSISTSIQAQTEGQFDQYVQGEYQGDLATLQTNINSSMSAVNDALNNINSVFGSLKQGDFAARITSDMRGQLATMKQNANDGLTQLDAAIGEIVSVAQAQSEGNLETKVAGQYEGQLEELKVNINQANETLQSFFAEISRAMEGLNQGDFSRSIEAHMSGSYALVKDDLNESFSTLQAVISNIRDIAQAQSEGRLYERMSDHYQGELALISEAVNQSMGTVQGIVDGIKTSGNETLNMARSQSSAADTISKRTESQAASLEQIAATMEQLTSTVQNNTSDTKAMQDQTEKVVDAASACHRSIQEAIKRMDEIRESSISIETFTNLIDEISFQTNLLALNAAVESARAGEHGRGFSVVASEVRTLAQRSANAAKEIKSLITENMSFVEQGSEAIQNTTNDIANIIQSVERSKTLIENLSNASFEQSKGINEINSAISQLDADTQQNAALLDSTSQAARTVEQQMFKVNDSLSFFKAANALVDNPFVRKFG